jgi:hypothetical protein
MRPVIFILVAILAIGGIASASGLASAGVNTSRHPCIAPIVQENQKNHLAALALQWNTIVNHAVSKGKAEVEQRVTERASALAAANTKAIDLWRGALLADSVTGCK